MKVLSQQDIEESNWVGWFNDETMNDFNQHHYFPNTFKNQEQFLEDCISSKKIQLGILEKEEGDVICGVVSLSEINMLHKNCEIAGIMEVERSKKNPALFLEAWSIMIRHGFEELGLYKIFGGSFHPHVADSLVRIFNFEIEGVRRNQVFKHNRFHDIVMLGVFRDTIRYPKF